MVKPLNLPNIVLLSSASSLLGRKRDAFMSSGLVGNDFPGPFDRLVLPDIGDEDFDEDPNLINGLGLQLTQIH